MQLLKIALIVSLALLVAESALAQEESPNAKAAFSKGVEQFNGGNYRAATEAFALAYSLQPSWKIFYNIGQCAAALKHYGFALDRFEAYLLEGGDEILEERQQEVLKEINRLRDLSGDLGIDGPSGAVVRVDDRERGALPLPGPIRVAGGLHQVILTLDGKTILDRQVKIRGRGETNLVASEEASSEPAQGREEEMIDEVEQEEPEEASTKALAREMFDDDQADAALPSRKQTASSLMITGWILVGTGAATALAGSVLGIMALKKSNALKDSCPDGMCASVDDYNVKSDVQSFSLATDIMLPIGGAFAATGLVMAIIGKSKERSMAKGRNKFQAILNPKLSVISYTRNF